MKMILGGLAALATTGGIAVAAPAHAEGYQGDQDGYAYSREMHGTDPDADNAASAQHLGITVCINRADKGISEREEISFVSRLIDPITQQPEGYHYAAVLVIGAEFHFCPQFLG
jgi:hypothetical protein